MRRFWRYVEFWGVLLFVGAVLCVVLAWLGGMTGKR